MARNETVVIRISRLNAICKELSKVQTRVGHPQSARRLDRAIEALEELIETGKNKAENTEK